MLNLQGGLNIEDDKSTPIFELTMFHTGYGMSASFVLYEDCCKFEKVKVITFKEIVACKIKPISEYTETEMCRYISSLYNYIIVTECKKVSSGYAVDLI